MLKYLLTSALVAAGLTVGATGAQAADKYTFALVPKNTNNPFFDQALAGCKKAEGELNGAVECLYIGPGEHGGGDEQAQIVQDLITKGVDGIAVSPANAAAMAAALQGAAAANHNERMKGIRDTLSGKVSADNTPGDRLEGQNGWKEVDGCPLYTDDDFPKSVQQMEDILGKYADLDAFTPTGGFPQFVPDAYEKVASKYKDAVASGKLALVVADTLPVQIELMKKGLSAGQVGQRPFEMGYKAMYFLKDIKDGKAAPADPTYTGLDVCTPQNVATCIGGGS